MNRVAIRRLKATAGAAHAADFAAFERSFTYPLGQDRFRIDHGADYGAFFRDLGAPEMLLAEVDGRLAGVLVAVRRETPEPHWYVCDLKVAPTAVGASVGRHLLRTFDAEVRRNDPAFGVSMNKADGSNRLRDAALRCPGVAITAGPTLVIASMDYDAWARVSASVEAALGPCGFYDPIGKKDLVLLSTGLRMPLLHLQHGRFARSRTTAARPGATHMMCAPVGHPVVCVLSRNGIALDATAATLCVGGMSIDWSALLTSDI